MFSSISSTFCVIMPIANFGFPPSNKLKLTHINRPFLKAVIRTTTVEDVYICTPTSAISTTKLHTWYMEPYASILSAPIPFAIIYRAWHSRYADSNYIFSTNHTYRPLRSYRPYRIKFATRREKERDRGRKALLWKHDDDRRRVEVGKIT